jgi:8-oxo-dGTP pyrophosphatase MutT (NUDIX family)
MVGEVVDVSAVGQVGGGDRPAVAYGVTMDPVAADEDLRRRVRSDVTARTPVDEREQRSIERFLEAYDRLQRPFDIDADPVHVTGSGIVVGRRGVLLHRHKRLGIWLQPGGHIDAGEAPWEAALRETVEETGIEARFAGPLRGDGTPELVHVDVHEGGRGHTHLDLRYLIDGGEADPDPPEGESQQIAWFAWDRAIELADPGLRGALESLHP